MVKRFFDIVFSIAALVLMGWIIVLSWLVATLDTKTNGFFLQKRVGQFGKSFTIIKLRTIRRNKEGIASISKIGAFLRNSKIDELPQFINVLVGDMSIVGPRPDLQGYYDCLEGENRKVLELRPGLTSEASLKYYNEEQLLAVLDNPLEYNDEVIFPDKVSLNLQYYYERSFLGDLKIIFKTLFYKLG
ncbi:sugar transferase [Flavobacterium enshiense DK69]|uniref:Sugar transferase n=1 Tax=Flavobacterium enshiense DK69 TaxID=1107311 RepID=V6S701_9FLAO|nr:sugar transferase [Flavobacterium enshiense]ESU22164.1 sugar transferase [Flavobacterium enshiense DK69]KGO97176.1 sugar transferase [Flavobacterium enshiense DK69]